MRTMKPTPLRNAAGKAVGVLRGKTLYKRAFLSKHLFRSIMGGAWGIDYGVLFSLPEDGDIEIEELENRVQYTATVKDWKENGIVKHFKQGTTDHYTQVFLPLSQFTIHE